LAIAGGICDKQAFWIDCYVGHMSARIQITATIEEYPFRVDNIVIGLHCRITERHDSVFDRTVTFDKTIVLGRYVVLVLKSLLKVRIYDLHVRFDLGQLALDFGAESDLVTVAIQATKFLFDIQGADHLVITIVESGV
jgi:hypothetical protein